MYLIWYSHKIQLPVGSPNSSCENVALYLSMGLTFIERTVLWLKKKRSNKKTTYYHNFLSFSSFSSNPLSSPVSPSLHPGNTHITIHCNALHCI